MNADGGKPGTSSGLDFLHHEAAGGMVLFAAALLAVACANSGLAGYYSAFLDVPVVVQVGVLKLAKPLLLWINDGLMAIFFFLVGMEIKRELLAGELSSVDRAALPAIAAVGGMIMPALIYVAVTGGDARSLPGWAIPTATDIAFAVGVMALLGPRIPASIKIFLLALAIIDDLGAIVIIALFYTDNLSLVSLALASGGTLLLVALNRLNVTRLAAYTLVGVFMWVCVLKSGVHATIAGVIVGLAIPLRGSAAGAISPLEHAEATLHPWVAFGVLPLFAFANAGVSFDGVTLQTLVGPVPLGIALGLIIGKQIGVFGATWFAVRSGFARLPDGATWTHMWGLSLIAGIGFTMSLFIGTLAFPDGSQVANIRIGVIIGSVVAAIAGYAVLRRTGRSRPAA